MRDKETIEDRLYRREATDAMNLHPNTRYVVCPAHGVRARVEDVYQSGNLVYYDGLPSCDPGHPFCWESADER